MKNLHHLSIFPFVLQEISNYKQGFRKKNKNVQLKLFFIKNYIAW